MVEELAEEWKEALLCAASAGDAQASRMYELACRVVDGDADTLDKRMLLTYIKWVESRGSD